jgi:hypothetical protein
MSRDISENPKTQEVADRLEGISEELSELAMDILREASSSVRLGNRVGPEVVAEEKRINRARRSIEKAVVLLRGQTD